MMVMMMMMMIMMMMVMRVEEKEKKLTPGSLKPQSLTLPIIKSGTISYLRWSACR
jgi:hypothetical protein